MRLVALLDGCRRRYSRLYFLSDTELARLLAVHYAPASLTPFVRRLFPAAAMRELRFSLPDEPATRPSRTTNTNNNNVQRQASSAHSGPGTAATGRSTHSSRPGTTKRLEEKFNGAYNILSSELTKRTFSLNEHFSVVL